jgi:hypothetical protein
MKTDINADRIALDDAARTEDNPTTEPSRQPSLNLKVRARIGVETRTQLTAGAICPNSDPPGTRGS